MSNALRRWARLVEGHLASQPRDDVVAIMAHWFAAHGISPVANLASPLAIHARAHTEDILLDIRDWPAGHVHALTTFQTSLRDDFAALVHGLGWHITKQTGSNTSLGDVARLHIAPNYPVKSASVPRMLTHHTPKRNLPSVLRNGLEPRADSDADRYPPRVYLSVPGQGEWELAQSLKLGSKDDWVMLRIDTAKLPGTIFYTDPEAPDNGVWTYSTIPPDAILAP